MTQHKKGKGCCYECTYNWRELKLLICSLILKVPFPLTLFKQSYFHFSHIVTITLLDPGNVQFPHGNSRKESHVPL